MILIAIGKQGKEIASIMHVALKTVDNWKEHMRYRFGGCNTISCLANMMLAGEITIEEIKQAKELYDTSVS